MTNIEEGTPLLHANKVSTKPPASIAARVANSKWKLLGASALFLAIFAVTSKVSQIDQSKSNGMQDQALFIEKMEKIFGTSECTDKRYPVLNGIDFVHYRSMKGKTTSDKAHYGTGDHEALFAGYKFWFQSADNKEKFLEDPSYYVPHWGGFCGWGISEEKWWSKDNLGPAADPNCWLYHQDKLILFMMEEPKMKFLKALDKHFHDGDKKWHSWFGDDEQVFNTRCYYNSFD